MAVSEYKGLREAIRLNVRDTYATAWEDTALDHIINEAQREYQLFAGVLTGEQLYTSDGTGVYTSPVDLLEPLTFFSESCLKEIPIISYRKLNDFAEDFRKETGSEAEAVCFDFEDNGRFRIYPVLPSGVCAGKLIYRRYPAGNKLEIADTQIVLEHCLFQIALLTNRSNAENHYRNFMTAVNEIARSTHRTSVQPMIRHGEYY